MRRHTVFVIMIGVMLVMAAATGCAEKDVKPAAESSSTVDPATSYMTEPPKKAKDAASDLNDSTGKTQDAIDDAADE